MNSTPLRTKVRTSHTPMTNGAARGGGLCVQTEGPHPYLELSELTIQNRDRRLIDSDTIAPGNESPARDRK